MAYWDNTEKEEIRKACEQLEEHGWLSPDGILTTCRYEQHILCIQSFGFKDENNAQELGWLRLRWRKWNDMPLLYTDKPPTQAQVNFLYAHAERMGLPPPDWLDYYLEKGLI